MERQLHGIHHVTAICADAQQNVDFYCRVLGLRLVKRTVNFDDPRAYHFYYGDGLGRPGTLMTFFPYPTGHRAEIGNGMAVRTSFAVPIGSMDIWRSHLASHEVDVSAPFELFGEEAIHFADPDGLPLTIVATDHADGVAAVGGPLPSAQAIQGIRGVTLSEEAYESTANLLVQMGFHKTHELENLFRFERNHSFVDVVCRPDGRRGHGGPGSIHHVAFRTANVDSQLRWRSQLVDRGANVSPVMDRTYFKSIYFREPGGVLFEIATDEPGMTVDESPEGLGMSLRLPPQYERFRAEIELALPPLDVPVVSPA